MTVVIIVLLGGDALHRCLNALFQQNGERSLQLIVPYDDHHPDVATLRAPFPDVQFIHVEGRHTYAELRTIGVQAAEHEIVALTEDHCIPQPHWCTAIEQAHAGPYAAVGGPVDKQTPDTALNWSLYLADYVRYANPMPEGAVDHLTDCNVTYKRPALAAIEEVWQEEFHEPEVHAALQARGQTLWLAPGVVVHQQRSMTPGNAIRDRYTFGRLFGGRRVQALPLTKRLAYAGSAVLLPVLLMGRVAGHVLRKRRYLGAFLRAFPWVLLLNTTWAWGEFLGYLTGRAEASLTPEQRKETILQGN